jgi:hypothetical protein
LSLTRPTYVEVGSSTIRAIVGLEVAGSLPNVSIFRQELVPVHYLLLAYSVMVLPGRCSRLLLYHR